MENFLILSNDSIRLCEKVSKSIKKYENVISKNIIKKVSYISKINGIEKSINKFLQTSMESIKFFYDEEKNYIKYEKYNFNGNISNEGMTTKNTKDIYAYWDTFTEKEEDIYKWIKKQGELK